MAYTRLPGPSFSLEALQIDAGTLIRNASPIPGSVGFILPSSIEKIPALSIQGQGKLIAKDFETAAIKLGKGVDPLLIRAFAEVESGGKSGFGPDGLPIIAYEGHWFRNLTIKRNGEHPYDKDYPLLSYPYKAKAGTEWKTNNKDQKSAWATLNAAIALDENAALQACSWGMFQVMGFNFKSCGYATAKAFAEAMKAGEKGQLDAFVGYCKKKNGMVTALIAKSFTSMATLYNGIDYGDYDKRIRKAYLKHGGK